ncbi:MAG: quinoprotein dehydrogenase-associated SoxYZ-like carrier [Proteobacteria bacterium]|nr:quinoprotein dehydrogenase-associated SoxYZ-like carrier [Pseudomonadota bacterium]
MVHARPNRETILPAMKNTTRAARRALLLGLGALPLAGRAAIGGLPTNTGPKDTSPEWEALRGKLFPGKKIDADSGRIQLIAPLRAAYGASVPVKIVAQIPQTPELYVKRLSLLVDKNPSPLAAQLDLTTEVGQANFETRIRVDEYSHVRVVAELSNGELHMDSRYVKTSGGCSAPPNRDALNLIGKTVLRMPEVAKFDAPNQADVTVVHPNDTGFELNNQTVMYIPSYFVRTVAVTFAGRKIFDADQDFSISENPTWRFNFVPHGPGELRAEVSDSHDAHYKGSLHVDAG